MIEICSVTPDDAERLLEIYSYYVKNTAISFEYEVPSLEEFRQRIVNISKKYPYICAIVDGTIIGYAYAGVFHEREAYRHSVELSIYVDLERRRGGCGRSLYGALEERLKAQGIKNLYACIAVPPKKADEYLTFGSMKFHRKMGFKTAGHFHACGIKFGRWYDMIYMEKIL
jgi:phosphinothricin acetyltransferase